MGPWVSGLCDTAVCTRPRSDPVQPVSPGLNLYRDQEELTRSRTQGRSLALSLSPFFLSNLTRVCIQTGLFLVSLK